MTRLQAFMAPAIALTLIFAASACGPKKVEPQTTIEPPVEPRQTPRERATPKPPVEVLDDFKTEKPDVAPLPEPTIAELNARGVVNTVYFALDRHDLTADSRRVVRNNVEWMKRNLKYNILIEGHCDERGSIEYNLALGQRRARAVRDYVESLGIPGSRLRIISYGEERPASRGHNEAAWSQNRRAAFVIE